MKKLISVIIGVSLLIMSVPFSVSASGGDKVNVRIEGISECLYDGDFILASGTAYTVGDVIDAIDKGSDALTVSGLSNGFITDINGDMSGHFGGWDGWLYRVNNVEASVGINDFTVKSGDEIVLFYGDPYGVGMQYPVADTSKLSEGILKFTSTDSVFDGNDMKTSVNPVADMTVNWETNGKILTLKTNADGVVKIPADSLTAGKHKVSVSKTAENGLPLVLRMPAGYSVTVAAAVTATTTTASSTTATGSTTNKNSNDAPKTGVNMPFAGVVTVVALGCVLIARKKND